MKHTPFVTLALLWVGGAGACLHAGGGSIKTPVTQGGQQAIILHDGKTQDLFLQLIAPKVKKYRKEKLKKQWSSDIKY